MERSRCLSRVAQAAKQQLTSKPHREYKNSFLSASCRALSSSANSRTNPGNRPVSCVRSRHAASTAPSERTWASHTTKRDASSFKGTYVAYGVAKQLFAACSQQADYVISEELKKAEQIPKTESGEDIGEGSGWWYEEIGLLPTFSSWSQVTFLHMYLLTARLRGLSSPDSVQTYNRYLFDHFSHEAERRMVVLHGITSRSIRVSYLKDLFVQWRGVVAAYDEGLVKGDAQLAAAVWRNLFKGLPTDHNGNELDWLKIAKVVLYMRRSLDKMAAMDGADVLTEFARGAGGETFFNTAEGNGLEIDLDRQDMELPGPGLRVLRSSESKQRT